MPLFPKTYLDAVIALHAKHPGILLWPSAQLKWSIG